MPSGHVLPRQSLSTYLQHLNAAESKFLTGITALDQITGGITRGKVTEVCGCPGSGKTSFAQATAAAIRSRSKVLWIYTSHVIPAARIKRAFPDVQLDSHIVCLKVTSLPALLVLFMRPPEHMSSYSLVVIDDLSTLLSAAFSSLPLYISNEQTDTFEKKHKARGDDPSTKRIRAITELLAHSAKVAEIFNCAILILTRMVSRIADGEAKLVDSLGEGQHLASLWTRIMLFRNDVELQLPKPGQKVIVYGVPHASVVKCAGVDHDGEPLIALFSIVETGLAETRSWFDSIIEQERLISEGLQKETQYAVKPGIEFSSMSAIIEKTAIDQEPEIASVGNKPMQYFQDLPRIKPWVIYDGEELIDDDFQVDENDLC